VTKRQKCTECGQLSLPGLVRGHGKCWFHWAAGCCWGRTWAEWLQYGGSRLIAHFPDK